MMAKKTNKGLFIALGIVALLVFVQYNSVKKDATFSQFTTYRSAFLSGGTFSSFITSANSWISETTTPPPTGDAIYVSKTGCSDSNPGTQSSPVCTIQKGVDLADAGDTVLVQAGNYPETVTLDSSDSGTASAYVTVQAVGTVTLDKGMFRSGSGLNYIKIKGFHVIPPSNNPGFEFYSGAGFVEILNNKVSGCQNGDQAGIRFCNTHDFKIDGNEVYDCNTGSQEAIRVCDYSYDFRITNNIVHDTTNIGIDVIGWAQYGQPERGYIAFNTVYNTGSNAPYSAGIYVDCGGYITVEYNTAYNNVRGLQLGCEGGYNDAESTASSANDNIFRYNVAYLNSKTGMQVGSYLSARTENNQVYNNVFYQNAGGEIGYDNTPGTNNQFYNNIFFNSQSFSGGGGSVYDHNIYYTGSGPSGTANLNTNPQFISAPSNFHVQAGSPACTGGRDGGYIGAFPCQ